MRELPSLTSSPWCPRGHHPCKVPRWSRRSFWSCGWQVTVSCLVSSSTLCCVLCQCVQAGNLWEAAWESLRFQMQSFEFVSSSFEVVAWHLFVCPTSFPEPQDLEREKETRRGQTLDWINGCSSLAPASEHNTWLFLDSLWVCKQSGLVSADDVSAACRQVVVFEKQLDWIGGCRGDPRRGRRLARMLSLREEPKGEAETRQS